MGNRLAPGVMLLLVVLPASSRPAAQDAEAQRALSYDRNAPLDVQETGAERRAGITIHDMSYASPKGGRVPAYLVVPTGACPCAAAIWGHWYWENSEYRNRTEFLEEAVALAPAGLVSLLTDGPIARPGHTPAANPLSEQAMADLVQQIVDMRRGADVLLSRREVDPPRLGYVGHSYNAAVGGVLRGLDTRFKAFVLMAGALSDEVDRKSEEYQRYRQRVGPDVFDAFVAKYAWLDPGRFLSRASSAEVLLQFATEETFLTPARAREYEANVAGPKRFRLYEAPHALDADARRDRIAFLTEKLRLRALDPAAIARIPDLPQPPPTRR